MIQPDTGFVSEGKESENIRTPIDPSGAGGIPIEDDGAEEAAAAAMVEEGIRCGARATELTRTA